MLLCLLVGLLSTTLRAAPPLLNLASQADFVANSCCGTSAWLDINNDRLEKPVAVKTAQQGDEIVVKLDNTYDVGTVVIVAGDY